MITANQYAVSKQTIQNKHIKINLLNFNYQQVAELDGNVISGSISIDANADIRRTCNIQCVVTNSSFTIGENNYIWLDKYIQILIGIDNILSGETEWFNQGIYIIDAPSYLYDAISHTLNFTGLDLMAKLTGQRNGYLPSVSTLIPQGSNVRNAIIQTITQLGGFTKYAVEECVLSNGEIQNVPNDIVMEQGATIYDLLVALRDIMPFYEIFFDVNGVFYYRHIPMGQNEPMIANDDVFHEILISETINTDFASVKNSIEVYGRDMSANYFATSVQITSQTNDFVYLNLTVPDFIAGLDYDYAEYEYIGFTMPFAVTDKAVIININDYTQQTAMDYRYRDNFYETNVRNLTMGNSYMITLGHIGYRDIWKLYNYEQFHALAEDLNPESPFYINKPIGKIYKPLYGGEYDNIFGTELCYERAKYELYLATNMQNSLSLNCVPTYYFDVNQLIYHAKEGETEQLPYLIKTINIDFAVDGAMGITAIRYYPSYPIL